MIFVLFSILFHVFSSFTGRSHLGDQDLVAGLLVILLILLLVDQGGLRLADDALDLGPQARFLRIAAPFREPNGTFKPQNPPFSARFHLLFSSVFITFSSDSARISFETRRFEPFPIGSNRPVLSFQLTGQLVVLVSHGLLLGQMM